MDIRIEPYTRANIDDVLAFERQLRIEEDFWGWEINDAYEEAVRKSFADRRFDTSISLLAYDRERVVGRIDSALIFSHFEGCVNAYLDWICVLKSCRHAGVAQVLMNGLRDRLRAQGIRTLVGLVAQNEEAQKFYRSLDNASIRDEGIWIDL